MRRKRGDDRAYARCVDFLDRLPDEGVQRHNGDTICSDDLMLALAQCHDVSDAMKASLERMQERSRENIKTIRVYIAVLRDVHMVAVADADSSGKTMKKPAPYGMVSSTLKGTSCLARRSPVSVSLQLGFAERLSLPVK